ncbi:MAG: hypothetical protein QNJ01_06985 [Desulfobacterales bacterium]|nr:hypothetical protein [Desulfobacterales bacterium]
MTIGIRVAASVSQPPEEEKTSIPIPKAIPTPINNQREIVMPLTLTLAFSSHRPEILPLAEKQMTRHDQVVVEEPPTPEFARMLAGELPVDDYLLSVDFEYPDFVRATARLLRRLAAGGIAVWACEPFTARLMAIHDHLADGGRPSDFETDGRLWPVYVAEREATGRLLAFYNAAAGDDFDRLLAAVCTFAQADAARFVLRDRLRAAAIAERLKRFDGRVYIEAGYLHLRLLRCLRRRLPKEAVIRPRFLLRDVYRAAGQQSHLYGPGDRLTLAFIFDRPPAPHRQKLLAARSLVYNRLIVKDEIAPGDDPFPDAAEEIRVIGLVDRLALPECRRLYERLRGLKPLAARRRLAGLPAADGA